MSAKPKRDLTRRQLLAAMAALSVSAAAQAAPAVAGERRSTTAGARSLVVYFSRSDNTRVIAGFLQRTLGADLHEIVPVSAYPEDYEATVAQATRERGSGFEPPLTGEVLDMTDYERVFLGFPVWGMSLPPVIRSFLGSHPLAGRTVVPFITHGGHGTGDSLPLLAKHAPQARIGRAFVLQCDQERSTINRINGWLRDSGIRT